LRHPKRRRLSVLNMCGILLYCYLRRIRYGRPIFSASPLAPPRWDTADFLSLVTADASEQSNGRANGSNELVNVQLEACQGKSYMTSDCLALFYGSLTTRCGCRWCTSKSCSLGSCCRSAAAVWPQLTKQQHAASALGQ
jgi:hypothetical protein